jgi:hypothetical protein
MSKKLSFSQRIGKTPVRTSLQYEEIDKPLDNALWNWIDWVYNLMSKSSFSFNKEWFEKIIWTDFFHLRNDLYGQRRGLYDRYNLEFKLEEFWYNEVTEWNHKYDLIEFIINLFPRFTNCRSTRPFTDRCNYILKKHLAGYTIISNTIVPITSEIEIQAIEESLDSQWKPINEHISKSLELLSDRTNPDYRNSIKESISALETMCSIIADKIDIKGDSLGKTLAILEKKFGLHPSLKKGFSAIYGYTSNADGIRHGLSEDSNTVTQEEAKFMLISCSAFINYLKVKLDQI